LVADIHSDSLLADEDRKTGLVRLVQCPVLLTQHIFLWFGEKHLLLPIVEAKQMQQCTQF
jgi:hypothetical protein